MSIMCSFEFQDSLLLHEYEYYQFHLPASSTLDPVKSASVWQKNQTLEELLERKETTL